MQSPKVIEAQLKIGEQVIGTFRLPITYKDTPAIIATRPVFMPDPNLIPLWIFLDECDSIFKDDGNETMMALHGEACDALIQIGNILKEQAKKEVAREQARLSQASDSGGSGGDAGGGGSR